MQITLKNYFLESIAKALNYPNQSFQVGRSKMRIMKLIDEKRIANNSNRVEILETLAEKDDAGKPKMKKVMVPDQKNPELPPKLQMQYDLTPENLAKFNDEFNIMMQEDCVLEVPESMASDLNVFKGLIANSQAKDLSDADIVILEDALEAMSPEKKDKPMAGAVPSPLSPKEPKK